jgi:hypothetical protein
MINSFKKVRVIVYSLLVIFVLSSCTGTNEPESSDNMKNIEVTNNGDSSEEKVIVSESTVSNDDEVDPISRYKLFYGEWEITKVLGYDYHYMESFEEADDRIGSKVSYEKDRVIADSVSIDKFIYNYTINPNIGDQCYFYHTLTNEELGLTGSYYVFVHVETYIPNVGKSKDFIGDEFFIVDDNSLIFVKNNVFYLAERVSYLDDSEDSHHTHI